MRGQRDEIPPGTLDMLILQTLARGKPLHGFEIAERILQTSADVLQVEEGSLYPALQRMLVQGWIAGDWEKRRRTGAPATTERRRKGCLIWTVSSPSTGGWRARSRAYWPRHSATGWRNLSCRCGISA